MPIQTDFSPGAPLHPNPGPRAGGGGGGGALRGLAGRRRRGKCRHRWEERGGGRPGELLTLSLLTLSLPATSPGVGAARADDPDSGPPVPAADHGSGGYRVYCALLSTVEQTQPIKVINNLVDVMIYKRRGKNTFVKSLFVCLITCARCRPTACAMPSEFLKIYCGGNYLLNNTYFMQGLTQKGNAQQPICEWKKGHLALLPCPVLAQRTGFRADTSCQKNYREVPTHRHSPVQV